MLKLGKKNFLRIPREILRRIQDFPKDDFFVGTAVRVDIHAVQRGDWEHLGIEFSNGAWQIPHEVVPSPSRGRYSRANVEGMDVKLKHLPKVPKSFTVETPNWGDWSRGSHEMSWTREIYQRLFIPPNGLTLNMELLSEDLGGAEVSVRVGRVISRVSPTLDKDLLADLNLLQENVGRSDVYPSEATREEFLATVSVDWELLPPGQRDRILDRISARLQPNQAERALLEERFDFLSSFTPINYINGVSGFRRYFGAQFADDLVALENLEFGNALYVMYEDWEELSKRSRTELLNGQREGFDRVVHHGNWQGRLRRLLKVRGVD